MPERGGPLDEGDHPKKTEPASAATAISAQTMSTFMRPISIEMRKPIPDDRCPENSATIAPISASVELILSALKMKGAAAAGAA